MSLHTPKRSFYQFGLTILITMGFPFLIVWPRLIDPHLGILDDPWTLTVAKVLQTQWQIQDSGSGRYRPAYYLYYALQYAFFGIEARGYYIVQTLVLVLTDLVLYAIIRVLTGSRALGWLAVLVFLTSSTVVENYYTLGKAEPRLVLFLLLSLYCFLRTDLASQWFTRQPQARRFPRLSSVLWAIASGVNLLLAALTKETALIILPVSLLWSLLAFGMEYRAVRRPRTAAALTYCGLNVLIFILFALGAYVYQPTPVPWAGSYTGSFLRLVSSLDLLILFVKASFDVFLLLGLTIVGASSWLLLRPHVASPMAMYALFCVLSAGAYASFLIFFWHLLLVYYLLPIAAWTAVAISLLTKILLIDLRPRQEYTMAWLILVPPLAFACTYSIPAAYNSAVALMTWDRVNTQMVRSLASLPKETRVFLFNLYDGHQYLNEIGILLEWLYHRPDIVLAAAKDPPHLLQRAKPGDLVVLNFGGVGNRHVWVRGIRVDSAEGSEPWSDSNSHGFRLDEVFRVRRQKRIFPPFALQSEALVLGWVGYRIAQLPHICLTTYADAWMGREAELWIADAQLPATVVLSGQGPPTLTYPMHIEIWARSGLLDRFPIWGPGAFELRFLVEQPADVKEEGFFHLRLVFDRTFIPMHIYGGSDSRELSVVLTNVRMLEEPERLKSDSP